MTEEKTETHLAVAAYYDGTGEFDPSQVELPKGFVIDRKYLEPDYAKSELRVAIEIALGSHGFGAKFCPEIPFAVVVLSNSEQDSQEFMTEANEVAEKFGERVFVTSASL